MDTRGAHFTEYHHAPIGLRDATYLDDIAVFDEHILLEIPSRDCLLDVQGVGSVLTSKFHLIQASVRGWAARLQDQVQGTNATFQRVDARPRTGALR